MKFRYSFSLFFLLYFLNYFECSEKFNSQYKYTNNKYKKNIRNKFRERNLNDDSIPEGNNDIYFAPLSIYIDTIQFNDTFPNELIEYKDNFIKAMYKAKDILEDFLEILSDKNGEPFESLELVPSLYETFYDSTNIFNYNFFITSNFSDLYEDTFSVILSQYMEAPYLGMIFFSNNLINEDNSKLSINYLTTLMLHHFIRLLGFSPEIAGFTNIYIPTEDDDYFLGIIDEYSNFTNVINYARKFFNCSEIERIYLDFEEIFSEEIELYGTDYGIYNLYWPKRFFLGELMTKFDYQEEQLLSGFTLSFLDDLPYLQIKKDSKYTGGLMKFGKNKGCEFFYNHCGNASNSLTTFSNEFFLPKESTTDIEPSCSSGRLSKTIYKLDSISNDEIEDDTNIIEYIISDNKGGPKYTNYCPIAHYDESETYIGNCSNIDNTNINTQRKEKFGNNSFCVISSLENTDNENPEYVPICYEMICSSLSLTIKIDDNYIVCPREGGQIKAEGFKGYLLCPDYNLICTSTKLCNNLLNCLEQNSEEIEDSFYYDYEIKTTQNSSIYNIENPIRDYGWELVQDGSGSCPYQCMQCLSKDSCIRCRPHYIYENNKCIYAIKNCIFFFDNESDICTKCEEGYFLVESNDNNKRYCEINTEKSHFYVFDSDLVLYKKCDSNPNCDECSYEDSKVKCSKCKNPYKEIDDGDFCGDISTQLYYEDSTGIYKSCSKHDTIQNCQKCQKTSNIFTCLECQDNYVLYYNSEQPSCLNKNDIDNTMYTLDEKKYYSCKNSLYNDILHCLECDKREECNKCTTDYTITNGNKLCIYTQDITDKKYYQDPDDNNYYYKCSKSLENCFKCENKLKCIECITSYVIEENDICIPYSLYTAQLYYFENDKYYICSKIPNCEKCSSKNQCIKCKEGYNFIKDNTNNLICQNIDISKYYPITEGDIIYYSKCEEAIENCDECTGSNYCTKCKTNFGIIEDDHTKCENLLEEKYYYNSALNKFTLCSNVMDKCQLCSTYGEFECKKCLDNYVFKHMSETDIQCELKTFFNENINFYHDDSEQNYYSCSSFNIAKNCLECTNKDICNKCKNGYDLHNDNTLCASKVDKENNMYAYNSLGLLMSCNDLIQDCKQCRNSSTCYNCYDQSVLLEDDTCLAKSIINENHNYIIDETTNKYISCSIIDNCISCTSKTECTSCQNGFILNSNKKCEKVNNDNDEKLSTGAIIGIVFGCLGFLIVSALVGYYLYKKFFIKKGDIPSNNVQNNIQTIKEKNDKIQENEDIEEINVEPEKEIEQNKIVKHTNRRSIHNN